MVFASWTHDIGTVVANWVLAGDFLITGFILLTSSILQRSSLSRDVLFRSMGVVVSIPFSASLGAGVERICSESLSATPIRSAALVLGSITTTLSFLLFAVLVYRFPSWLLRKQLHGYFRSEAVADTLWFGNFIWTIVFLFNWLIFSKSHPHDSVFFDMSVVAYWEMFISTVFLSVKLICYGIPRLLLDRPHRHSGVPLWIVLPVPLKRNERTFLRRLSKGWSEGPVTWIAPATAATTMYGTHSYVAQTMAQLEVLFPANGSECLDWYQTIPAADCWESLPVRELYPADKFLPDVVACVIPAGAKIVVAFGKSSGSVESSIDLSKLAINLLKSIKDSRVGVLCLPGADVSLADAAFQGRVSNLRILHLSKIEIVQALELVQDSAPRGQRSTENEQDNRSAIWWLPTLRWPLSYSTVAWTIVVGYLTARYPIRESLAPSISDLDRVEATANNAQSEARAAQQAAHYAQTVAREATASGAEAQHTASESLRCCNENIDRMERMFRKRSGSLLK